MRMNLDRALITVRNLLAHNATSIPACPWSMADHAALIAIAVPVHRPNGRILQVTGNADRGRVTVTVRAERATHPACGGRCTTSASSQAAQHAARHEVGQTCGAARKSCTSSPCSARPSLLLF